MKKEKVMAPAKRRSSTTYAKKGPSFAVMAACIGVMIATVMQGIKKDKEEAAEKEKQQEDEDREL